MWTRQMVQTFQRNPAKYFPVRKTNSNSIVNDTVSLIQSTINKGNEQDKERHLQRHQSTSDNNGKDTPWLKYTGWKRQFAEAVLSYMHSVAIRIIAR